MTSSVTPSISLAQAAEHLRSLKGKRVLVLTHAKPDGDAIGSLTAMVEGLRLLGAHPHGLLVPIVPANIATFAASSPVSVLDVDHPEKNTHPADCVAAVVVDTQAWAQIGAAKSILEKLLPQTLVVDHHLTGDLTAPKMYVDTKAAAAGEMVFEALSMAGVPVGDPSAQSPELAVLRRALFVAMASDTGWFRFSNTSPKTHRLAATLQECGVDAAAIYENTMQNDSPQRMYITARALASTRFLGEGGKIAVMTLAEKDFADTGASHGDYEGVVDFPRRIKSVQISCLASEVKAKDEAGNPQTQVRISFRSKPDVGHGAVDCTQVAGKFGGGGHARAAGAKVHATLAEVLPRLEAELLAAAK